MPTVVFSQTISGVVVYTCLTCLMFAAVGCEGSSGPRGRRIGLPDTAAAVLSGEWQFRRDPAGRGQDERWFDRAVIFPETIRVPGSWDAQGKGIPGVIT